MDDYAKVFSSNITRTESHRQNNLYDLLNIVPAKPLKLNDIKKYTCDFSPKTDKYYIPKRKSRLKVKTVRDIRKSFEHDTYSHLFTDLESQQNTLFKKIRRGSSRDDSTKILAKNILKGDSPISRSTWQMLINLNPEQHKHPRQFVLWNGKYIQVNGSVGGTNKLIFNYDLANKKIQNVKKRTSKHNVLNKKKGLLRNSLAVQFKPGPLRRKQLLDDSHQKYHLGKIELIDLPKPGLDIKPTYGTALESTITHFLNNLRSEDGTISQKWAELAVSVLGTLEKSNAVQFSRDCVTFDLNYKYNQNRILMRRDADNLINTSVEIGTTRMNTQTVELAVLPEIKDMMTKILDSVDINIKQDKIYTQEKDDGHPSFEDSKSIGVVTTNVKDKTKRKFCELDRLDVTVITLPETKERYLTKTCDKVHCSLGCICDSLESTYNLRQHCGRVECMFECKCDFSKYKDDLLYADCSELMPGVLNLDKEIHLKLAKEEQKFHQTVIVTGQKRILLKAEKRNWKTSKKYADFYCNMRLKNENQKSKILSIVALKLNLDNVETWCMVHKLYKCFCKGKFSETCVSQSNETVITDPVPKETNNNAEYSEKKIKRSYEDTCLQPERSNLTKRFKIFESSENISDKIIRASRGSDTTTNPKTFSGSIKHYDTEYNTQTKRISGNNTLEDLKSSSDPEIVHKGLTRRSLRTSDSAYIQKLTNKDKKKKHKMVSDSESSDYLDLYLDEQYKATCSRTNAYEGRKYTDGYYKNTHDKILEMEKNDKRLQERLAYLNKDTGKDNTLDNPTVKTINDMSGIKILNMEKNNVRLQERLTNFNKDTSSSSKDNTVSNSTVNITNDTPGVKIMDMAKTDIRLQGVAPCHNKQISEDNTADSPTVKTTDDRPRFLELLCDVNEIFPQHKTSGDGIRTKPNRKLLSSETKLVAWLESNYKMYKQRNECFIKKTLEPPKLGKVVLHSWDFILERYRERKNLFLVSAQRPFRIFMAVHTKNPFFENCININDIRFADLNKYPQTVRNLLINATDLKDNFCILRGLSCCWELIGSVTKVNENNEVTSEINVDSSDMDSFVLFNQNDTSDETVEQNIIRNLNVLRTEYESTTESPEDAGSSKWFVMTVENDFYEIRFFRKGFFVKYETIVNAISVARLSGKTVRLSSKKCIDECDFPQFGIYAIPNDKEYCVFVGPYEMEDTLGIETIKTISDIKKSKRTRGFWITTNKVDNFKVVEDPLSFVSSNNSKYKKVIPLESHFPAGDEINMAQPELPESARSNKTDEEIECSPSKKEVKIVKPIKIRKTNGFYHLASDGVLKKISVKYPQNISKAVPVLFNSCLNIGAGTNSAVTNIVNKNLSPETLLKPIAEKPRQIQLPAIYSTQNEDSEVNSGMPKTIQEPIAEVQSQIHISSVYSTHNEDIVDKSVAPETLQERIVEAPPVQISAIYPTQNKDSVAIGVSTENIQESIDEVEPHVIISAVYSTPNEDSEAKHVTADFIEEISFAPTPIKISDVHSTKNDESHAKTGKHERSMFILKPEEINRKLLQSHLTADAKSICGSYSDDKTRNINIMELDEGESFSPTVIEGSAPDNHIYVISDDENDTTNSESSDNDINWRHVWIECTNNTNLGWIAGRRNADSLLSFKFPGYEYSEFYAEEEAIAKINLEMANRTETSTYLELQWKVIESPDEPQGQEIHPDHLYREYIFAKEGLVHTSEITKTNKDNLKTYSKSNQKDRSLASCSASEIDSAGKD